MTYENVNENKGQEHVPAPACDDDMLEPCDSGEISAPFRLNGSDDEGVMGDGAPVHGDAAVDDDIDDGDADDAESAAGCCHNGGAEPAADSNPEIRSLLADGKSDHNQYKLEGGTDDGVRKQMSIAVRWPIATINKLPFNDDPESTTFMKCVDEAVKAIAWDRPDHDDANYAFLRTRLGKLCPKKRSVMDSVKNCRKELASKLKREKIREAQKHADATGEFLKYATAALSDDEVDFIALGRSYVNHLVKLGTLFFLPPDGGVLMLFKGRIYHIDSPAVNRRRELDALVFKHTGHVFNTQQERKFLVTLAVLAREKAVPIPAPSTLLTDVERMRVYIPIDGRAERILRISPEGTTILPNGVNEDGVLLLPNEKMGDLAFNPEVDIREAYAGLKEIASGFTCDPRAAMLPILYLACVLLKDFVSTAPHLRLEGPHGSGKTTCEKALATIINGVDAQGKLTVAAMWASALSSLVFFLDNVETCNITRELLDLILMAASGATKVKRSLNSDSDVVEEHCKIPIVSTGIEPLTPDKPEAQSRTLTLRFDRARQTSEFVEHSYLRGIRERRGEFLSAIFVVTGRVLDLMSEDHLMTAKEAIVRGRLLAGRERCAEYVAAMYLAYIVFNGLEDKPGVFETIEPEFAAMLSAIGEGYMEAQVIANPISNALRMFFNLYRESMSVSDAARLAAFAEKYPVIAYNGTRIEEVCIRKLYATLSNVAKNYNIRNFAYAQTGQFKARFEDDMELLEKDGFKVIKGWNSRNGTQVYTIIDIEHDTLDVSRRPLQDEETPPACARDFEL